MTEPQHDRCAIVVGGASGIGAATAQRLAKDGFFVVVADVLEGGAVVDQIVREGGAGIARHLDLSEPHTFEHFLAAVQPRPTAVVITAALIGPTVPLQEYRLVDWERVVRVNLTGTFFFAQAAANLMAGGGYGRLIFFMSAAGRSPGKTTIIPYIATKGAITPLVYSFASAYKGTGLLVAAIDPGRVLTEINRGHHSSPEAAVTPDLPLGRILAAEEVAEVAAFLCSPQANGVTAAIWGVSTRP